MKDDKPSLRQDESGAMMLMSLFMALFLVGMLFYVMGTGDAILYRRIMQDSADAGGFAASVTSARGMNLIVLLNIVMMIMVGVLMLGRLVEWVLFLTSLFFYALCGPSFGTGCVIGEILETASNAVEVVNDQFENVVETATSTLNSAQQRIKTYWPYLAEGRAIYEMTARTEFDPPVITGFVVPVNGPKLYDGSRGLPVEDDDNDKLCQQAVRSVGMHAASSFGSLGALGNGALGQALNAIGTVLNWVLGVCDNGSIKPPQKVVDNRASGGKVWLGHEEFQYRSLSVGESLTQGMWSSSDQGVRAAQGFGEEGQGFAYNTGNLVGRLGIAQSEYYYGAGEEGPNWEAENPKDQWMWHMEWRARLRRVRVPQTSVSIENIASACSAAVGGGLMGEGATGMCAVVEDFVQNAVAVH